MNNEYKQLQDKDTTRADVVTIKTVGDALCSADAVDSADAPTLAEEPEPEPEPEKPDYEKLIAEAEQRGYLRGVNEQIEKRMAQPGLLEIAMDDTDAEKREGSRKCGILNVVRPCVWDL